jgi:hypothetical protein
MHGIGSRTCALVAARIPLPRSGGRATGQIELRDRAGSGYELRGGTLARVPANSSADRPGIYAFVGWSSVRLIYSLGATRDPRVALWR